ncbi:MAG: hydroxymethylglutaryl-CoA lyase [Elusimicrobia bacterium]|nr:hydroxymethylglutaryl-CoA lyase [Elusimicrobiota bacterium]
MVPAEIKIKWIESLIGSGMDMIQVGSFVHPKRVPQMADTDEIFAHFAKSGKGKDSVLSALVLNEKGLERGLACGVDMFCMGVSASETHSKKNTGMSVSNATERIIAMAKKTIDAGKKVQVSVQSAFGCSYEGRIDKENVLKIVKRFLDADLKLISLADTAGYADPSRVENLFGEVLALSSQLECACHFHDTYGLGLANVYAAYKTGVKYFESAFAGLGGCPFTAISSGNVCSEDMIHMFSKMGVKEEIEIDKIISVAKEAEKFFERSLPGIIHKTGLKPEVAE